MDRRLVIQLTDSHAHAALYERRKQTWFCVKRRDYASDTPCLPSDAADLRTLPDEWTTDIRTDYPDVPTCRLVLPTTWCLIHPVELPGRRWNETSVLFEFEEYVPVALEKLTCHIEEREGRKTLVVGVYTEAIQAFLDRLAREGCNVEVLTIDALLLNGCATPKQDPDGMPSILLDSRHMTMVFHERRARVPASVRTINLPEHQGASLVGHTLRSCSAAVVTPPRAWRLLPFSQRQDLDDIVRAIESTGCSVEVAPVHSALAQIQDAAAQMSDPPNLRRGQLASADWWSPIRRRLEACTVVVIAFLVVLGARVRADNIRYGQATREMLPLRGEIYESIFPAEAPSPAAALRMRSECIRLEGLTERAVDVRPDPNPSGLAALDLLHEVTAHIPAGLKLHVTEIVLDDQGLRLAGQTTGHGAAGTIVQELNQVAGLVVDPPHTKLREDGMVDFRLRVTRDTHAE